MSQDAEKLKLSIQSESVRKLNPHLFPEIAPTTKLKHDHTPKSDESKLHGAIIQFCKDRCWLYFHGSMAQRTARTVGEPDFTVLLPYGIVLFVECKSKTGKLSVDQQGVIAWAAKLGHTIHVVRSIQEFQSLCAESLDHAHERT